MSSAARYIPRAPRYTFRPDDEKLMRFAGMEKAARSSRARVRNLSATGISFVVDPHDSPIIGDMLKIEFGLPGAKQVAWFADVVRVETQQEWDPELGDRKYTLVALRFRQLPKQFTKAIQKSLSPRLEQNESEYEDSIEVSRTDAPPGYQNQFLFWSVTAGMLVGFALMSLPERLWFWPFESL